MPTVVNSTLGELLISSDETGITKLDFSPHKSAKNAARSKDPVATQLTEYFSGKRRSFDLPLHYSGTPFQRAVWETMLTIPYGKTMTYKEIAAKIRRPKAFRAVANACGANPLPILIPCHRVVATNGLGGYSSGIDKKIALLKLEGALSTE